MGKGALGFVQCSNFRGFWDEFGVLRWRSPVTELGGLPGVGGNSSKAFVNKVVSE